ncbi:glycoside hydrolase family 16 protein [Patellaria atrata CBS 101060]|uniref:Glycoside hydrolase family 16 protein n=1 Tax=Patellaria atrata CBS 101060 TaxID=1346257 RepID=A0A9P4S6P4_9PEZI|nr:glycoside hydrolase family 16 protein [Patellaria atrata CBS 101060]
MASSTSVLALSLFAIRLAAGQGCFNVPDVGLFKHHDTFTFTGSSVPDGIYVSDGELVRDTQQPGTGATFDHIFNARNVRVRNGFLELVVPGRQTTSPLESGQVGTWADDMLYLSARTTATFSSVPGTCHGIFFYKDDCNEIDIEYLSDGRSLSNPPDHSTPLQYTNQDLQCNRDQNTHTTRPRPADATTALHEYRIDWTKGKVVFRTDGAVQTTFTSDVPSVGGTFLLNNWANGDPGWTLGPPASDSIFKVQKLEIFYNRTSDTGRC